METICPHCPPEVMGKGNFILEAIAAVVAVFLIIEVAHLIKDMAQARRNPMKKKEVQDGWVWVVLAVAVFAVVGISVVTGPLHDFGTWFYGWFKSL